LQNHLETREKKQLEDVMIEAIPSPPGMVAIAQFHPL